MYHTIDIPVHKFTQSHEQTNKALRKSNLRRTKTLYHCAQSIINTNNTSNPCTHARIFFARTYTRSLRGAQAFFGYTIHSGQEQVHALCRTHFTATLHQLACVWNALPQTCRSVFWYGVDVFWYGVDVCTGELPVTCVGVIVYVCM